ncbi:protein kinase C substrate 80K-H [Ilyonectria robusta]
MQHPPSWALLSAIYAFTLAAAGSLPRGVGPSFAAHYQGKDDFSCITNTAIKLSLSQVNDNSCDCPDGSDEPGTAACANLDALSPEQPLPGSVAGTTKTSNALPGFWCANEGHIGMYVPFLYVNDGVCDYELCCDGSEEFRLGGVKCENRCAEIGKEYRRLEDEKRRNMEKAARKRDAMTAEAQELRRKVELKINTLQDEIRALETKRAGLQQRYREVEQEEKGKVVRGEGGGGKLGVLVGLAKTRINELRATLEDVLDQRDELRERAEELEEILKKFKEEYNPNFNDEGVKAAVKSFEDYSARQDIEARRVQRSEDDVLSVLKEDSETNGVNWKEFEGVDGDDTDIRELPPPHGPLPLTHSSLQPRGLPALVRPKPPAQHPRRPARVAHRERRPRRQRQARRRVDPSARRPRGLRARGKGPQEEEQDARRRKGGPGHRLRPRRHLPRPQGQVRQRRGRRVHVRALLAGEDGAKVQKGPRQHKHGQLQARRPRGGRRRGPPRRQEPRPGRAHGAALRGRPELLERA